MGTKRKCSFSKDLFCRHKKHGFVWETVNQKKKEKKMLISNNYIFLSYIFNPVPNKPWLLLVCITSLLKTVGKGEIACNEQFLLFPLCVQPIWRTLSFFSNLTLLSANSSSLEESRIYHLGKSKSPFFQCGGS